MAKLRTVGRPVGGVHKISHVTRITKILNRFGVIAPVAKIKAEIVRMNKKNKPENQIPVDKALNVKIAQVRSKMLFSQIGVACRAKRGRMTNEEREVVAVRLELAKLQSAKKAEEAVLKALTEEAAEVPADEALVAV